MLFDRFWAVRTNWAAFPGFAGHPNPCPRAAPPTPCRQLSQLGLWTTQSPYYNNSQWWQIGCMRCLIKLLHLKHKWCRVGPWWVPYGTLVHMGEWSSWPPHTLFITYGHMGGWRRSGAGVGVAGKSRKRRPVCPDGPESIKKHWLEHR